MAFTTLNRAQAYSVGSDLWVLPEKNKYSLYSKIDWYLNFQLTRASEHKPEQLSPQLKSIASEYDLPDFAVPVDNCAPLLVVAENGLPTKTVVEITVQDSNENWVQLIHKTWMNLGHPPLRVFLPHDLTVDGFKQIWPGSKSEDITLVPA